MPAAQRAEPDPWSVDAMLPRSGDPERPNVKVELTVLETRASRDLWVRGAIAGTVVRGVVNVRAALAAAAREGRQRSRTSAFVVVQEGREGRVQISQEARPYCGSWTGLAVFVGDATPEGVDLCVEPYVGRGPGEWVSAATTLRVAPGQALVIGGVEQSEQREERGILRHEESSRGRQVLVLLQVEVLG